VIVCHWDPLGPKERKRQAALQKKKRKQDGTYSMSGGDFDYYDIFEDLETRRTFDLPQYSMVSDFSSLSPQSC
jgi:hypothetical protein